MTRGLGPILAVLVCSVSHQALAQGVAEEGTRERNVGVRDRPRPDYEALGGRLGGFLIFPKVTAGVIYDDNIFALETAEVSDTLFTIQPNVQVLSQWSRHALNVSGGVSHTQYSDFDDESFTNYNFGGDGRLDVDRFSSITASARFSHLIEPRTALDALRNAGEPIRYDRLDYAVGASRQFNRIRVNLNYDASDYNWKDAETIGGVTVSQDYRDATVSSVNMRLDYTMSPDTFIYVRGRYNKDDFDLEPPAVTASRDSDGWELTAGADFDLSNLIRGQVEAGYLEHEYESPQFGSFTGLQVRGRLEYYPTQLTTVSLSGSRSVQNSGNPTTPGYLSTAVGLQVDHELLRNVILTARGDYEHADFSGIDRSDDRYAVSLSGTYLINRNVGVSLSYYYLDQQSKGLDQGSGFQDNRFMATTTLQY